MVKAGASICFACGQSAGEPPRLNRLPTGEVCATCRDRVLDSLPAPLPRRASSIPPAERDAIGEGLGEPFERGSELGGDDYGDWDRPA